MLPQFALADSFAGCYATMATMFAIYYRDIVGTGKGQIIDVSLWESLVSMLGPNAMVNQLTGMPPMRTGNRTITSAPRNLYRTKDNRWVALAGSTPATAIRLFNAIGQPDLASDPRFKSNKDRLKNVVELDKVINAWTISHNLEEITTIFRQHSVPVGPVFDVNDIMNNLHAIFREMVVEVPDEEGSKLKMEGVFPKMFDTPGKIQHAGKNMGEDNEEIFKKRLNISDPEFLELKNKKII